MGCGEYYVYTMSRDIEGDMVNTERKCSGHDLCPACIDRLRAENARYVEALEAASYHLVSAEVGPLSHREAVELANKVIKAALSDGGDT
jgi:hypothetical protein